MPDVKVWKQSTVTLNPEEELDFFDNFSVIVAEQMSCYVPKDEGDGYEFYRLTTDEIDITVFADIAGRSKSNVIIEVAAYDFEDRMRNITERLKSIAALVARELDVEPSTVSISFIPIKQGHWTVGD